MELIVTDFEYFTVEKAIQQALELIGQAHKALVDICPTEPAFEKYFGKIAEAYDQLHNVSVKITDE